MSVALTTPSRLGQVNSAGDAEALFLKLFSGEILTEFDRLTVFKDKHFVRQIAKGKSATFPMIGRASSFYHDPGAFIEANQINQAEKVITLGKKLVVAAEIADIDEMKNHYDVRGPYAKELGAELAWKYDANVARAMVLAARQSSLLTGRAGGSRIIDLAIHTDVNKLRAALFTAAQTFDEKDITSEGRNAFFKPAQYYLLAQDPILLSTFNSGSANISTGKVETAAGITLVKTNNLPQANDTSNTNIPTNLQATYANTKGVITTDMAAGTLQLADISMEQEREIRRQGTFMVASMAVAHDWLRPECAIELATA